MTRLVFEATALPAGWSQISGAGIRLVLARPFNDPLTEQLRAILPVDRPRGHDLLDDLLDILLCAGVRGLPEFVAVDEVTPVRLVLRGATIAEVTIGGEVRSIVAGGARTWADVQLGDSVEVVSLHLPPMAEARADGGHEGHQGHQGHERHDELTSYDDLFGSTQRAMAFHTEGEPLAPSTATGVSQPATPPRSPDPTPLRQNVPPQPFAADVTLAPPLEVLADADADAEAEAEAVREAQGHLGASVPPVAAASADGSALPAVPPSGPPIYGCLRLSTGDVVNLDRGVLLGRAPTVDGEWARLERPHVLRLASPDNDISRNHAEVLLKGHQVMIQDLGSTNGTTVALLGQPPSRLRPLEHQILTPGALVSLGDEVSFTYEIKSSVSAPVRERAG
jgi:hypothetical protein